MNIGEQIKRIRAAKGISQKEVVIAGNIDKSQLSRIETGKTDPSVSTLTRIAEAMNISLSELFADSDEMKEVNSFDKTTVEKVALIEQLEPEEKQALYTMIDAFISKKKLKSTLSNLLNDLG